MHTRLRLGWYDNYCVMLSQLIMLNAPIFSSQVEHTLLDAKFKSKTAIKRQMNETADSIF